MSLNGRQAAGIGMWPMERYVAKLGTRTRLE